MTISQLPEFTRWVGPLVSALKELGGSEKGVRFISLRSELTLFAGTEPLWQTHSRSVAPARTHATDRRSKDART